jgi:protein-S-isoprenylcysteine O-methyltransferase Ste14
MELSYLFYAMICLLGLGTRTGYELLKKAGKVDPKNKWIFTLVFVAMGLLLGSWPIMSPKDPFPLNLPEPIRWTGICLAILGVALAIGGLVQLRGLENIDHLVATGIYSKIRHPMYCGFILWILGWVIAQGGLISLIVAGICMSNILYWRKLEEEKLVTQFGEDYQIYRKQTWF